MVYAAITFVKPVVFAVLGWLFMAAGLLAQAVDPGRKAFESRCARCHGADGNGGEMGPAIAVRLTARDDRQLTSLVRDGLPALGMPPSDVADPEMADLVKFLRTIQRRADATPAVRMTLQTTTGKTLDGHVLGEGFADLQLLTDDKRVHLLRRAGGRFRDVTSGVDWPTYNGAAARGQPDHLRRDGRRARRERVRRRARSGDRQGSLAILDGPEARAAGIGDMAGQGHRARGRTHVV